MGMAAVGAEGEIAGLHCRREPRGNRFLSEGEMAGALDQILQEQIIGALLSLAELELGPVQLQPQFLADVVIVAGRCGRCQCAVFLLRHKCLWTSQMRAAGRYLVGVANRFRAVLVSARPTTFKEESVQNGMTPHGSRGTLGMRSRRRTTGATVSQAFGAITCL